MNFRNQFQEHERVHSNHGTREHVLYSPKVGDDGTIELISSGKIDIYDEIQSHKDSCDIHVLLKRFANGEPEVLARAQGAYGDFTEFPQTYAQLLQTVIDGEKTFMSLPIEIREKFGHSFEQWMAGMDNMESWMDSMGYKAQEPVAPVEEVKPDVQE